MSQEAEVNRSCDQRDVKSLPFFRRGGARLTTRVDAASGEPGHGLRIGEPMLRVVAPCRQPGPGVRDDPSSWSPTARTGPSLPPLWPIARSEVEVADSSSITL